MLTVPFSSTKILTRGIMVPRDFRFELPLLVYEYICRHGRKQGFLPRLQDANERHSEDPQRPLCSFLDNAA